MAYGRSSNGGEFLSDQNISTDYVLPFVHDCEWRLGDCGLDKDSPRSRGNVRGRSYIPKSSLVCWALLDWQHMGQLLIGDPLQLKLYLVASSLGLVFWGAVNSSQFVNYSAHGYAACKSPLASRTLHRGFYMPPWVLSRLHHYALGSKNPPLLHVEPKRLEICLNQEILLLRTHHWESCYMPSLFPAWDSHNQLVYAQSLSIQNILGLWGLSF
jgi:hypothetical protein